VSEALWVAVGAGVVSVAVTPAAMAVARRTGVVDRPGPLKPQASAVPYLGGAAVFVAALVGAAAGRPLLAVPLALAVVLGTLDDWKGMSPWTRLAGEVVVGLAVALIVPVHLVAPLGAVLVLVVTVLLVNGMNLLDGLDALAGSVAALAAAGFAVMLGGDARDLALALSFGFAGFLVYNRPPARIYLGDGGAYLGGAALAVLLAEAWRPGVPTPVGVGGLVVVAVPVAEVAFAVVRRARAGASLVAGDRGHPYDRLRARGWPGTAVSASYAGVELVLVLAAASAARATSLVPAVVVAVLAALVLMMAAAAAGGLVPDRSAGT
jgi:UDP-GlcNAc:undecaprenyl-phosphate/decaprenyl-phosphate GlcNAc-1-phosphate transferase